MEKENYNIITIGKVNYEIKLIEQENKELEEKIKVLENKIKICRKNNELKLKILELENEIQVIENSPVVNGISVRVDYRELIPSIAFSNIIYND